MIFDDENNGFNGMWLSFSNLIQMPAAAQPIVPPKDSSVIAGTTTSSTTIQGTIGFQGD